MDKIKVIVSDLDGTLISYKDHGDGSSSFHVSDENRDVINRLTSLGLIFTVATGRHTTEVNTISNMPYINAPLICNNGGLVYDVETKQELRNLTLSEDLVKRVVELSRKHKKTLHMCLSDGSILRYSFSDTNYKSLYDTHPKISEELVFDKKYPCDVQKFIFTNKPKHLQEWKELLSEEIKGVDIELSKYYMLEINPIGAKKCEGIKYLSTKLGVPLSQFMVFGDALNDYTMFKEAGVKVAMCNAVEDLKGIGGTYVVDNTDHKGVSRFLTKWFLT